MKFDLNFTELSHQQVSTSFMRSEDIKIIINKRGFNKLIEFLLLDALLNIIMTETLYNNLKINGTYLLLVKACIALVMARLSIFPYPSKSLRCYSYNLLKSIDLISNGHQ